MRLDMDVNTQTQTPYLDMYTAGNLLRKLHNEPHGHEVPLKHEVTECIPDCIMELDAGGNITYVNPVGCREFGEDVALSLLGTPWVDLWLPEHKSSVTAAMEAARQRRISGFQGRLQKRWLDVKVSPLIKKNEKNPSSILIISRDITASKEKEYRLREAEERSRLILESTGEGILGVDADGLTTFVNPAATKMLGFTADELIGKDIHNTIHHSHEDGSPYANSDCPMSDSCRNGAIYERIEEVLWRKDKSPIPVSYSCAPMNHHKGDIKGAVIVFRDNTELRTMMDSLHEAHITLNKRVQEGVAELLTTHSALAHEATLRQNVQTELQVVNELLELSREGITITDADGTIMQVNRAFTTTTGYSAEEAVGRNLLILKSSDQDTIFYREMWRTLVRNGQWAGEIWTRRKNGETYPEWLSIGAIKTIGRATSHYVAVFQDISQMKEQERRLNYQAYHDALTDLPNRKLFNDRLRKAIENEGQSNKKIAVINIDLDNFKNINDSLGHLVGDHILQTIAGRLVDTAHPEDTVARFSGDSFMIMAPGLRELEQATDIVNRIQNIFQQPILVNQHEFHITGSMGASIFPDDGLVPDTLVKNAEIAMYGAKESGRNSFRFFTASLHKRVERRMILETEMRRGLERDEFIVFYQPKLDLSTMKVGGMEALVRWRRDDGSLVSPAEFIVVAEETGLIIEMGRQVLEQACQFAADLGWIGNEMKVAVNLSGKQFADKHLVNSVADILAKTGLPAANLELEVTETSIITDINVAMAQLEALAQMGISIAVDDFGTGYSSLYYLKQLPLTVLKVDRSFISDIPFDSNDAIIAATIITLGKQFGLTIVAEGVETQEQLDFLQEKQCDQIQGYLFAKPMPENDLRDFLIKTGKFAG